MAKKLFGGVFLKGSMSKLSILGMVLIFILLAVLIINYNSSANSNRQSMNISSMGSTNKFVPKSGSVVSGFSGSSNGDLQVMFFNVDWCPHCVRAKEEWKPFCNKYDNQMHNGYKITCVGGVEGVNCTNNDDPDVRKKAKEYNIQHFPTVYFVKDGQKIEFDGKVTMSNLEDFMKTL